MNTNDLIENVNFKTNKTAYIYLSHSAHGQYKIGNTIHPKTRMPQISTGSFWTHKVLSKIYVEGLVPRLENTVLDAMEEQGFKRDREMFLITHKTKKEVTEIFESIVHENVNEMRRQVRAKTRYETKILAEHGVNEVPVYTSIARV
tara:strand:- start:3 stop:440 length:438 start_codon:yes stop_codon:yes gene_type:complete